MSLESSQRRSYLFHSSLGFFLCYFLALLYSFRGSLFLVHPTSSNVNYFYGFTTVGWELVFGWNSGTWERKRPSSYLIATLGSRWKGGFFLRVFLFPLSPFERMDGSCLHVCLSGSCYASFLLFVLGTMVGVSLRAFLLCSFQLAPE